MTSHVTVQRKAADCVTLRMVRPKTNGQKTENSETKRSHRPQWLPGISTQAPLARLGWPRHPVHRLRPETDHPSLRGLFTRHTVANRCRLDREGYTSRTQTFLGPDRLLPGRHVRVDRLALHSEDRLTSDQAGSHTSYFTPSSEGLSGALYVGRPVQKT